MIFVTWQMLNKGVTVYLCMLTCLDGMKLNCLAKRYLETSSTARGFWSHFQHNCSFSGCHLKTACTPFWIFLSHLLCPPLQTSTLCVWQLCRLCSLNLVRQNICSFYWFYFFLLKTALEYFIVINAQLPRTKNPSFTVMKPALFFFFLKNRICAVMKTDGCD